MKKPGALFSLELLSILGFAFYLLAHALNSVPILVLSFCLMLPPFFICLIIMVFGAAMH